MVFSNHAGEAGLRGFGNKSFALKRAAVVVRVARSVGRGQKGWQRFLAIHKDRELAGCPLLTGGLI